MEKTFEQLSFTDDFLFCKVLENNEEICKELVQVILGKKIKKIAYKNKQKVIEVTSDGKGIRLDVYIEDENNTVFDLEMQTTPNANLPKRSRYYQGMIDLDLIEKGSDYSQLKESYVVFICLKNPIPGKKRHKYLFQNRCDEDKSITLEDKAYKVFVTPDSEAKDISDELASFLNYLVTKLPSSELTNKIQAEVDKAKQHEEWRTEYMTLLMRDKEKREEGRIEGRIEGIIMLLKANMSAEEILKIGYSKEELKKAEEELLQPTL